MMGTGTQVATLLTAYCRDDSYVVWKSIEAVLLGLGAVMERLEGVHDEFCAFVAALVRAPAAASGWDNKHDDGHLSKRLRAVFVALLCTFAAHRDNAVQAEARARFAKHCTDPQSGALPSEYKVPVYRAVARLGAEAEHDALMRLYRAADDDVERKYVMLAMGAIPDPAIQRRTMAWALSDDVKMQDMMYPFKGVAER
jgi:hypothetical protein